MNVFGQFNCNISLLSILTSLNHWIFRGISLPALSVAAAKGVSSSVGEYTSTFFFSCKLFHVFDVTLILSGAYARIRKQFKVPIADMEGES